MGIRSLREAKLREYQKATLVSASPSLRYGATCGARFRRGLAKLAPFHCAQTTRSLIHLRLRSSAQPGRGNRERGQKDKESNTNTNKDSPWRVLVSSGIRYSFPHPLCMRRGAEVQTDQGWRCLSVASLARPRLDRAPQVAPQRSGGDAGTRVAFSLLTFFWRSKRK